MYRSDVDGLRAVAVLSVLAFHAFPQRLRGGFIGVDIFFVISGFLISTIIIEGLRRGGFSFVDFYSRRVRRIFPALLLVLAFCGVLGWYGLLADEFKQLGKHIGGGAGFVSNLVLWAESGYFDATAESKPLLHLWSLGIEEQFYLVWPLLLWVAWRLRVRLLVPIVGIGLASLALCVSWSALGGGGVALFYSPLTRFWELLAGAALAYAMLHKPRHRLWGGSAAVRECMSLAGLTLIAAALLLVHRDLTYPGGWAALPVAGTVMLIAAGPDTWIGRHLLSNRVVVWFGLISYPLYLWHWPLLSFAGILTYGTPTAAVRMIALAVSVLLAWLTFRWIEKPIRFGGQGGRKTAVLTVSMVAIGLVGLYSYMRNGFEFREPLQARELREALDYQTHWAGWQECTFIADGSAGHGGCRILDATRPADVVVVGDSHAGHLATGLRALFSNRSENVAILLHAGCFPVRTVRVDGEEHFKCHADVIEKALQFAERTASVRLVVLAGYANYQLYRSGPHEAPRLDQAQRVAAAKALDLGVQDILGRLVAAGKKVVFLVDVPELTKDPKSCVRRIPAVAFDEATCPLHEDRVQVARRGADYQRVIDRAARRYPGVVFTDTMGALCDDRTCRGSNGNELLYASRDHLTPTGSVHLMRAVAPSLLGGL